VCRDRLRLRQEENKRSKSATPSASASPTLNPTADNATPVNASSNKKDNAGTVMGFEELDADEF
jgi:hypothetical protein